MFKGARCLSYGARVINEGGLSGLPQLHFPGGALIGCAAGLLNVAKIKGIHNALQSGQLAAQAIISAPQAGDLSHYSTLIKQSCVYDELHRCRNVRHYFQYGLSLGTLLTGLDLKLFRGRTPWTLKNKKKDRSRLKATSRIKHSSNTLPDFCHSRQDALYFANLHSRENQPNHLHIGSLHHFIKHNTPYHHPETRYCPANVYEYPNTGTEKKLTINASNCLHCKACDIKDPSHQIHWQLPEGGSGPNYTEM